LQTIQVDDPELAVELAQVLAHVDRVDLQNRRNLPRRIALQRQAQNVELARCHAQVLGAERCRGLLVEGRGGCLAAFANRLAGQVDPAAERAMDGLQHHFMGTGLGHEGRSTAAHHLVDETPL